ncbi:MULTISPECIES: deoxynucleoside kinase [Anoxybacillus]|uniref:Deoxyguanosine kinase n=2 Tax=Anoxybacillus TaxID=150247 RepID=B7GFM2_ANOFW|nr:MULTISPECIES: deoxynucleoside kinase [Anoxybacillus]ACJ32399.1 Deoxyguanosine kinase [Anoxybacillus flavithermus WK1]AST05900.1 deoxynucleoside kinase [Anoxybacillus flavithermus]OOE02887.1 deoxynucleoside kinase [Anoxybacillus kestanbolensis]
MSRVPFITVEGPIGVGKTSLAKVISTHFQYELLKEIVDENPFLGKFYENIEEWSFQTEMFFLCNRYKQLEDVEKNFLNNGKPVVADYHIFKNLIFAKQTLKGKQYEKYVRIYDILTNDMPKPNVVIYLHASLHTLLERIAMRGREFEKNIDPNYLQQLSHAYEQAMEQFEQAHPHIPVLRFNGDELDFVHRDKDRFYILNELQSVLKRSLEQ